MPRELEVDGIGFRFNDGVRFIKYDETSFYHNKLSRIKNGIKAVDIVACGEGTLYLIEVKDYRRHAR